MPRRNHRKTSEGIKDTDSHIGCRQETVGSSQRNKKKSVSLILVLVSLSLSFSLSASLEGGYRKVDFISLLGRRKLRQRLVVATRTIPCFSLVARPIRVVFECAG